MSRKRLGLLALGVIGIVALGALVRQKSGTAGASALSAAPEGWLAARTYLERRGSRIDLLARPLDQAPAQSALVLTFPWQALPSPEELAALRQRLSSGGEIVFAYTGQPRGFGETFAALELGLSLQPAREHPPLSPRRWWAFVNADWRLSAEAALAPDSPDAGGGAGAREVVIRAPDSIPKAPEGAEVLFRGEKGIPAVFRYTRARGRVLVLPADALSNARLGNPGNADLLESIRVALGPSVAFDEYHHGLVSPEAAVQSGSASSLDLLLIQLLLLYLLSAWTLGRRFGASWREPPELASSTSAFLLSLGGLHRRLRHSAPAALRLIEGANAYDSRVTVPDALRHAAFDAREPAFLEIARFVARRQRRGRSD